MKPFNFVLDYPTNISFYVALCIVIIFTIFVGIVLYMAINEVEITFVKGSFLVLVIIMILPFIFSFDTVVSKNAKDKSTIEELNAYKKQFNLLNESGMEYYSVVYNKTKYYDFKSLIFSPDNDTDKINPNEINEFRKICFEKEGIDIVCSIEHDSEIYILRSKTRFERIFDIQDNKVEIDYKKLKKYNEYDLSLFNHQKENIYSENEDVNLFLNNLNKKGINISNLKENKIMLEVKEDNKTNYEKEIDLDEISPHRVNLTIKEDFPLTFKKYETLLKEIELLNTNTEYILNIKFNNTSLSNEQIKNELINRKGGN